VVIIEWQGLVQDVATGESIHMPEVCNTGSERTGRQVLDMLQKQQQVGTVRSGDSGLLADQANHNERF